MGPRVLGLGDMVGNPPKGLFDRLHGFAIIGSAGITADKHLTGIFG